jgi:hypothetical protein
VIVINKNEFFKNYYIDYDWKTLYVGYNINQVAENDITNFAVEYLSLHPQTEKQSILQLAWGGDDINYQGLLRDKIQEYYDIDPDIDNDEWLLEKRKWRFYNLALLKEEHENDLEALLRCNC